ncbi:hypothetical protein F444_00006 [Phytophthora nicotianae P1976]|uniref:Uncharacterized protein n=1 Tax=Phytophthora nicotianae P1976 TaxID=1317066 RepID=A0A081B5N2_PHYNI|nr:hypothetical protein F444_00006 [Phytophthora nicotianae P1976]
MEEVENETDEITGNSTTTQTMVDKIEREENEESGGNRLHELSAFPTDGLERMAPGKRSALREENLTDTATLDRWAKEFDVTRENIQEWQNHFRLRGLTATWTNSQSSEVSDQGSEWSPPSREMDIQEGHLDNEQEGRRTGRFIGMTGNLGMNRLKEHVLKIEWNDLKESWQGATTAEFPTMPMSIAK